GRARTATLPDKATGGVKMVRGKNGKMRPLLIHHTPEKTRTYEGMIRTQAIMVMGARKPIEGPVAIDLWAVYPIPKSWPRRKRELALLGKILPTVKPDLDNIEKAVKDALNGVVWTDDAQVCGGERWK